ncbi:MAG: WD40 repeat domain-containing protein [Gemmataceae bacterium]
MTRRIEPLLTACFIVWALSPSCAARAFLVPIGIGALSKDCPAAPIARIGSADWRLLSEPDSIVVSPDGKVLAVSTNDFTVELLDAQTGKRRLALGMPRFKPNAWEKNLREPETGRNVAVAFSPDGKKFAAYLTAKNRGDLIIKPCDGAGQHEERRIQFWKKHRGKPKLPPGAATANWQSDTNEYVSAMSFSPDGKLLATGVRYYFDRQWVDEDDAPASFSMEENIVRLWNLSTGAQLLEMTGHEKEIQALFFSPDGKTITTVGVDGNVCFWITATGKPARAPWKVNQPLFCAACSPDGKLLAGGSQGSVLIWETATGEVRDRLAAPGPEVRSLAFTRDGKLLAGAGGLSVRLWNADTGTFLRDAPKAANPVTTVAFSADGTRLYSGHEAEQAVRCLAVDTLKQAVDLNGHAGPVYALAYTADSKQVLTSTHDDDFRLWNANSGKPSRCTKKDQRLAKTFWFASMGRTRPLLCDHRPNRREVSEEEKERLGLHGLQQTPELHNCSADGKLSVSLKTAKGKKPVLIITNNQDNSLLREFVWENREEVSVALSPDGRTVAASSWDNVVCFFDVAAGKKRRYQFKPPWVTPTLPFSCAKFSPDSSRLVIVGIDGMLRVLAVADGRVLAEIQETDTTLGGVGPFVSDAAFSPDGKTLAIAKPQWGHLSVWEISTKELIYEQSGERFLFSPDNRLVAIRESKALQICDLYTGRPVRKYKAPIGFIGDFAFSPNGRQLAAACSDTTVSVWETANPVKTPKSPRHDDKTLLRLWNDLEQGKSPIAYKAIDQFLADPDRTIPFLKKRLQAPTPDARRLQRLIADLDHQEFAKREAASCELSNLGLAAGPFLRTAIAKDPATEMRRRLENLLRDLEPKQERLSIIHSRANQVLERIGTKEAQELLKNLAEGADFAPHLTDAREVLERMRQKD